MMSDSARHAMEIMLLGYNWNGVEMVYSCEDDATKGEESLCRAAEDEARRRGRQCAKFSRQERRGSAGQKRSTNGRGN